MQILGIRFLNLLDLFPPEILITCLEPGI